MSLSLPPSTSISGLSSALRDDSMLPIVCRLQIKLQVVLSLTLEPLPFLPPLSCLACLPPLKWNYSLPCCEVRGSIVVQGTHPRWDVPPGISFNPCALVQSGTFFLLSLVVGVNLFSALNSSLKCYLLGHYLHAFSFNSSDTIPMRGGGGEGAAGGEDVGFTEACLANNTIINKQSHKKKLCFSCSQL